VLRRAIELRLQRFTRRLRVYVGHRHVAIDILSVMGARRLHGARENFDIASGFDAALKALATALNSLSAEFGPLRELACDVVIADRWLLYDVVELDVMDVPLQATRSAAAATLADVGGSRADALEVSWQWQRDGNSVLAMGISRESLSHLRAVLAQQGLATRSVTGEFVAVFNAQRTRLTGRRVVFAVSRDSGAQVALLAESAIRSTSFELGCTSGRELVRVAVNAMRARGDDTTAGIDFVVDPGEPPEDKREHYDAAAPSGADHWLRVSPPEWAAAP
jgi:hypothetical protein